MSTESNLISTPEMSPVEALARNIVAAIKNGQTSNHIKTDESESWEITGVNDPGKSGHFKLEITKGVNKSGKKYCHHSLYRLTNGEAKIANLGIYKKKVLYTIAYNLESGKVFKKIKQDPATIKALAKDMKTNPDNWSKDTNKIVGTMNNESICITREAHLMKNGKTMYRVSASKNGEEFLNGSQLMVLFK